MNNMKIGKDRFDFYLLQLQNLFFKASVEHDPAMWLYTNNARTPLFMLEGLSKLYSSLHNESMFSKIKEQVKKLEDLLGQIDYYDNFLKEFSKKEGISPLILSFLEKRKEENIKLLHDVLIEKKWIAKKSNRLEKIREKLDNADWMKPEKEMNAIKIFYQDAIDEINNFYRSANGKFTELENQVHALRRKLRWLSIYPQAMRGCIQLTDTKPADANVFKYLVPEIVNSPFNTMPEPGDNTFSLLLEKNYFLALSWMISELGKIKDAGLEIIVIDNALDSQSVFHETPNADLKPGGNEKILEGILENATRICNDFFKEKNLEKLVSGVSAREVV